MSLSLKIEREVQPTEVAYLVLGTGVFGWAPWWRDFTFIHYNATGEHEVEDPFEDLVEGDLLDVTIDDPSKPEGSGETMKVRLALQQVIDAVPNAWKHLTPEMQRDVSEDLGAGDAEAADIIMQYAVLTEIVFG
jgi:hypothetical protein